MPNPDDDDVEDAAEESLRRAAVAGEIGQLMAEIFASEERLQRAVRHYAETLIRKRRQQQRARILRTARKDIDALKARRQP